MATYFYRDLPWWGLTAIGAWIIAWQLNLQHETIHGHPTRNRASTRRSAAGRCRSGFPIRSTARPISRITGMRISTDPLDDPESYYWADGRWRGLGPMGARSLHAQTTLLGRMILGPAWTIGVSFASLARDAWRGKGETRVIVARHLLQCAPVLIWVIGVCGMPFWVYVACFVYPGVSLAMVRSFAEHRAEPEVERRTAIVENARILGPLFLFNNLHAAHHLRAQAALVSNPEILSPQSRRADRAQRRPCLQRLFRRRAALSPDVARPADTPRLGRAAA